MTICPIEFRIQQSNNSGRGLIMPDYKAMYLKMVRASEKAINILIEAQRECEELYLSGPELTVIPEEEKAPELRDSSGADG